MKESQINKSFSLHILRSFSEWGVRSLLDFNDVGFPPSHPRVGGGLFVALLPFSSHASNLYVGFPPSREFYPIIIPAIVAEINDAIEPPIKAFIPNLESVFRCPGAKEPMPPIWIPMEAKLAKPQSI